MEKVEVFVLAITTNPYRSAYMLLMAACNDALDLLSSSTKAAVLLQNAVEQAEEIFLQNEKY